jgi:hypothetical protein
MARIEIKAQDLAPLPAFFLGKADVSERVVHGLSLASIRVVVGIGALNAVGGAYFVLDCGSALDIAPIDTFPADLPPTIRTERREDRIRRIALSPVVSPLLTGRVVAEEAQVVLTCTKDGHTKSECGALLIHPPDYSKKKNSTDLQWAQTNPGR